MDHIPTWLFQCHFLKSFQSSLDCFDTYLKTQMANYMHIYLQGILVYYSVVLNPKTTQFKVLKLSSMTSILAQNSFLYLGLSHFYVYVKISVMPFCNSHSGVLMEFVLNA
jgi:hypothetical protein